MRRMLMLPLIVIVFMGAAFHAAPTLGTAILD